MGQDPLIPLSNEEFRGEEADFYVGPIREDVWEVLHVAWESGFQTSSNFARYYAVYVAVAASLGWISVMTPDGLSYGNVWRLTRVGHRVLVDKDK